MHTTCQLLGPGFAGQFAEELFHAGHTTSYFSKILARRDAAV
jgi:hypothetical protein